MPAVPTAAKASEVVPRSGVILGDAMMGVNGMNGSSTDVGARGARRGAAVAIGRETSIDDSVTRRTVLGPATGELDEAGTVRVESGRLTTLVADFRRSRREGGLLGLGVLE